MPSIYHHHCYCFNQRTCIKHLTDDGHCSEHLTYSNCNLSYSTPMSQCYYLHFLAQSQFYLYFACFCTCRKAECLCRKIPFPCFFLTEPFGQIFLHANLQKSVQLDMADCLTQKKSSFKDVLQDSEFPRVPQQEIKGHLLSSNTRSVQPGEGHTDQLTR